MYLICRLDLIHITINFHQIIPYGYLVMVHTRIVSDASEDKSFENVNGQIHGGKDMDKKFELKSLLHA